mmetsp:Transcript_22456/g.49084  ORF Transcript_22456/g.49084 Transcript_22456/m.49084 type:complete len:292 (-) Transcript_22456:303-1178(-)|eukprot:CAMPEP_0204374032 /NCGR_PEP_ID=MMETSP0469-20131031/48420_1 /ASSEMBLY_ACC=CAM_ASM_000384 /TAXON_ID=2969 /ORGANISM="Oxyrrhis marina" /LENGTH=291 /DNA_ID=CAMNT_0051364575 /DNA_START=19 /DNA_END=894 /DNA_ORIENTATION=-
MGVKKPAAAPAAPAPAPVDGGLLDLLGEGPAAPAAPAPPVTGGLLSGDDLDFLASPAVSGGGPSSHGGGLFDGLEATAPEPTGFPMAEEPLGADMFAGMIPAAVEEEAPLGADMFEGIATSPAATSSDGDLRAENQRLREENEKLKRELRGMQSVTSSLQQRVEQYEKQLMEQSTRLANQLNGQPSAQTQFSSGQQQPRQPNAPTWGPAPQHCYDEASALDPANQLKAASALAGAVMDKLPEIGGSMFNFASMLQSKALVTPGGYTAPNYSSMDEDERYQATRGQYVPPPM